MSIFGTRFCVENKKNNKPNTKFLSILNGQKKKPFDGKCLVPDYVTFNKM